MAIQKIYGQWVDLHQREVYPAEVVVDGETGRINTLTPITKEDLPEGSEGYLMPGFVDAHVHVESSMLVPSEFARIAVLHGTVATVSDPHEIANVLGREGVEFMIENGKQVPFKFHFGAPSCVPATSFETAGAILDAEAVASLLDHPDICYLAEMMNWPGVLHGDPEVLAKIKAAHDRGLPVDGHAPQLMGDDAVNYIRAGISTDHECVSSAEALNKIKHGMKVLIREGSAAKNFNALIPLMKSHPEALMFCSDDKHPDDLLRGHINLLVRRAVHEGYDLFDVLHAACVAPVKHYRLRVGLGRTGDFADFIRVRNLRDFDVVETYIQGKCVARNGETLIKTPSVASPNAFQCDPVTPDAFRISGSGFDFPVIVAQDGELVTEQIRANLDTNAQGVQADSSRDILKIAVLNRYKPAPVFTSMIRGMGLKRGAIASTVAHDSHNIVAVGVDDESLAHAVNALVAAKGGIIVYDGAQADVLPLPVAGLMSTDSCERVGAHYEQLDARAKELGSTLHAPFMTLSFMALLVIPSLKISDLGLFDGRQWKWVRQVTNESA
jgi:adenine deaminase